MEKNALNMVLGLTLFTCTSVASASVSLVVTNTNGPYSTSDFATPVMIADGFSNNELSFNYGTLSVIGSGTGIVTYTYLGSDAGFTNSFVTDVGTFTNQGVTPLGTSISENVGFGDLNFSFQTSSPSYAIFNGTTITNTTDFGYGFNEGVFGIVHAPGGSTVNGNIYQDLLIYNDPVSGGDYDYNDLVVGVNFRTSPVPEPESYGMMLAGLGLLGFIAARRKNFA